MEDHSQALDGAIQPGEEVYDADGRLLGFVSGFTDDGFEAETVDTETGSTEEIPGHGSGEGYLMWRCTVCGEMDEIEDGLPPSCPNCGADREAITEAQED